MGCGQHPIESKLGSAVTASQEDVMSSILASIMLFSEHYGETLLSFSDFAFGSLTSLNPSVSSSSCFLGSEMSNVDPILSNHLCRYKTNNYEVYLVMI